MEKKRINYIKNEKKYNNEDFYFSSLRLLLPRCCAPLAIQDADRLPQGTERPKSRF